MPHLEKERQSHSVSVVVDVKDLVVVAVDDLVLQVGVLCLETAGSSIAAAVVGDYYTSEVLADSHTVVVVVPVVVVVVAVHEIVVAGVGDMLAGSLVERLLLATG